LNKDAPTEEIEVDITSIEEEEATKEEPDVEGEIEIDTVGSEEGSYKNEEL
jgi:hypothetical protein